MAFINQAVTVLQTLVMHRPRRRSRSVGVVGLMEGYGNVNPGAKSQGIGGSWLAVVVLIGDLILCSRCSVNPAAAQ